MRRHIRVLAVIGALQAIFAGFAAADDWKIVRLSGDALVFYQGRWINLKLGDVVADDAFVRTLASGSLQFSRDRETIAVEPNTQIQIIDRKGQRFTTVKQYFGTVGVEANRENVKHFAVRTPFLAAVVKGTVFGVATTATGSTVAVERGLVGVQGAHGGGHSDVSPGRAATVSRGQGLSVMRSPFARAATSAASAASAATAAATTAATVSPSAPGANPASSPPAAFSDGQTTSGGGASASSLSTPGAGRESRAAAETSSLGGGFPASVPASPASLSPVSNGRLMTTHETNSGDGRGGGSSQSGRNDNAGGGSGKSNGGSNGSGKNDSASGGTGKSDGGSSANGGNSKSEGGRNDNSGARNGKIGGGSSASGGNIKSDGGRNDSPGAGNGKIGGGSSEGLTISDTGSGKGNGRGGGGGNATVNLSNGSSGAGAGEGKGKGGSGANNGNSGSGHGAGNPSAAPKISIAVGSGAGLRSGPPAAPAAPVHRGGLR